MLRPTAKNAEEKKFLLAIYHNKEVFNCREVLGQSFTMRVCHRVFEESVGKRHTEIKGDNWDRHSDNTGLFYSISTSERATERSYGKGRVSRGVLVGI